MVAAPASTTRIPVWLLVVAAPRRTATAGWTNDAVEPATAPCCRTGRHDARHRALGDEPDADRAGGGERDRPEHGGGEHRRARTSRRRGGRRARRERGHRVRERGRGRVAASAIRPAIRSPRGVGAWQAAARSIARTCCSRCTTAAQDAQRPRWVRTSSSAPAVSRPSSSSLARLPMCRSLTQHHRTAGGRSGGGVAPRARAPAPRRHPARGGPGPRAACRGRGGCGSARCRA